MKALFIVNPAAGHGRGEARWAELERGRGFEARLTRAPGDGAILARRALEEGFDALVAVGGDGTLGEVVDGFLSAPEGLRGRAALGTLPVGSGCDFARHFGLGPGADPEALLAAVPRRLDAGRVDYRGADGAPKTRFFLNIAAFGLAGDVALRVQRRGKPWGGTLSYMLDSVAALLAARPRRLRLRADGETLDGDYHLVTLANTSTFGGGMRIAPGADPCDGALELVTVAGVPRWELLRRFPRIYGGTHVGVEGVGLRRVRKVEASSDAPAPLNIDGDLDGRLPATFEVLPSAVPFLLP